MSYCYEYKRMQVTVDLAIVWRRKILVVERKNDPFQGHFALPGGFCEMGERLETAARRELKEETGLLVDDLEFIKIFDAIKRDPRDRTISALYFYKFEDDYRPRVKAGDDAANAKWIDMYEVLDGNIKLAFDHNDMVTTIYRRHFSHG